MNTFQQIALVGTVTFAALSWYESRQARRAADQAQKSANAALHSWHRMITTLRDVRDGR